MRVARYGGMCLLLFAVFVSPVIAADDAGRFVLSPSGGVTIPLGDFASTTEPAVIDESRLTVGFAQNGYTFGGTLEYYLLNNVSAGIGANYHRLGLESDALANALPKLEIDAHYRLIEYSLFIRYLPFQLGSTSPYVKAGVMHVRFDAAADIYDGTANFGIVSATDPSFGVQFTFGINQRASKNVAYFVEGDFSRIFSDGAAIEAAFLGYDEQANIAYDGQWISIKAGLSYYFGGD